MLAGSALEDHLIAPRGRGRLADAPHAGAAGGAACGDLVRIAVRVQGDRVAEAGFEARGCAAARAAGSAVVELAEGAPLFGAARLTPADVAAELGGLDPAHRHAATLAADALHRALGAAARDGAPALAYSSGRTLVAMSGGVDSAVAAGRALDEGHEAIAVTLELWADPEADGTRSCCSPHAVTGARALAHRMGIPHVTLDLRSPFREHVVEDFVSEHAAGRTPNPCVRCNGGVRFGAMLRLAASLGAARLATGHYARIERDPEGPLLRTGADPAKDQAYMLARLEPSDLERLWFPLGELEKPEVRRLAREAGLSVAEKPESQDLCFLAGTARERFLRRHGGAGRDRSPAPGHRSPDGDRSVGEGCGEIVDRSGRVLGRHGGQERFTVGQRRGIGVAAPEPLYVLGKDPARDRVVVGPRSALATTRVAVARARLHRHGSVVDRVKLRYRSTPVPCAVSGRPGAGTHDRLVLALGEPVHGVAPGQTACLMRGEAVVGWATIDDQGVPGGPSDTARAGAREIPGLPC